MRGARQSMMPLLAAAAVLAVATGSAYVITRGNSTGATVPYDRPSSVVRAPAEQEPSPVPSLIPSLIPTPDWRLWCPRDPVAPKAQPDVSPQPEMLCGCPPFLYERTNPMPTDELRLPRGATPPAPICPEAR